MIGTTFTNDISPGDANTLLNRLASCDGKHADAAVIVWEHCQWLVKEVRSLRLAPTQPESLALLNLIDELSGGNASCLLTPDDDPADATTSALARLFAKAGRGHWVPHRVWAGVMGAEGSLPREATQS